MLQLNHRKSFDFDCFTSFPLKEKLLHRAKQTFGEEIMIQVDTSDVLLLTTPEGVEITFVYYPYPPLHHLLEVKPMPLFHLADLASDKARTIGRRGAWRDYVDLFFFLKREVFNLEQIIQKAQQRFAGEFNDKLFLEQLVYFNDLEINSIEFLQESYLPDEIKDYLAHAVDRQTTKRLR